ncbi:MAG: 4-hydroxy-tetrahydrodipicolinate synthase [Chlamydiota bacterium]
MRELNGTITACITPFNDKSVDYAGLKHNLEEQVRQGVDGVLVLGTTGEPPTLTHEERIEIIKTAVEVGKGRTAVWVGTGANSTEGTIQQTMEAQNLGADVALIVSPYYNCPTQEGIYQHIRAVHEATSIPICLYNIPKRAATKIETPTILRLSELERVIALKDATGDTQQLEELVVRFGHTPQLSILSGDDALTFSMIALGAKGVVSVASNIVPSEMVKLVKTLRAGNIDEAREIHYSLLSLFKALFIEVNPIPIKAAMTLWDLPAGLCRLPLTVIEEDNLRVLSSVLQHYHHLRPTIRRGS